MLTVEITNARDAQKKPSATSFTKLCVRQLDLNLIQSGDILTLPNGPYVVFTETLRNGNTYEYINVECVRNGNHIDAVRFIPSLLMRVMQKATAAGNPSGEFVHSRGTAVDSLQGFATVDAWLQDENVKGRRIRVTYETMQVIAYKPADSMEPDRVETGRLPIVDFV